MLLGMAGNGVGQGFNASSGLAMCVFCKELQEWIVGDDKIRIHDGVDQLHIHLFLAKVLQASHIDVVEDTVS